jgi:hypothetical protein
MSQRNEYSYRYPPVHQTELQASTFRSAEHYPQNEGYAAEREFAGPQPPSRRSPRDPFEHQSEPAYGRHRGEQAQQEPIHRHQPYLSGQEAGERYAAGHAPAGAYDGYAEPGRSPAAGAFQQDDTYAPQAANRPAYRQPRYGYAGPMSGSRQLDEEEAFRYAPRRLREPHRHSVQTGYSAGSGQDWERAGSRHGEPVHGQSPYSSNQGPHRALSPPYQSDDFGFAGRGPKGYQRSDERIKDDLCERLTRAPDIDPSDVTVEVARGKVTLDGRVDARWVKHQIENLVDACPGVKDIDNRLSVESSRSARSGGEHSSANGYGSSSQSSASTPVESSRKKQ